MLRNISISNYVLIKNLEIDFEEGFSVITGETGAGKSILLGALNLVLGERADKEVVMQNEKKCIIEAHFDLSKLNLQNFFESHDLDEEQICILRRELTSKGKSRAFINDTPVKLPIMKELGTYLMDVHSQNQNHQLSDAVFRLSLIDAYSNQQKDLAQYKLQYLKYKKNKNQLAQLNSQYQQQKNEQEYHQFLFDEIEKAQVKLGEQKEIEEELELLNHAEDIKSALHLSASDLINGEENIVWKLQILIDKLSTVSNYQAEIKALEERLQSLHIEIKDIGEEAQAMDEQLIFDEGRLDYLNTRLETIFSLSRKHSLENADDLIAFQDNLSKKLFSLIKLEESIEQLSQEQIKTKEQLENKALKLRKNRKAAALTIEKLLEKHLHELGMEKSVLNITFKALEELSESGRDKIEFMFSSNSGAKPGPINKVASGGELSRIMLSFKYALAVKQTLPSIIFDEIDSGVSGEIADKLADIMRNLGSHMQVISISHLPQIAAKANHHYLVYKENDSTFTRSLIKRLDKKERLNEVAAMLSGSNIGTSAIEHAKELLNS
ncbi:MAG: DNA repair protein RecN [Bacteroidetes bacterium 4572_77]|nr:MAG: DNA repair protein RecN [Bacteroidetes bacterium 4572_77]